MMSGIRNILADIGAAALLAAVWLAVPIFCALWLGQSRPAWLLAGAGLFFVLVRAGGWELELPEIEHLAAGRSLLLFLFLLFLVIAAANGGFAGIVFYGLLLGFVQQGAGLTAATFILAAVGATGFLENLHAPLSVRCGAGAGELLLLFLYVQTRNLEMGGRGFRRADVAAYLLWGLGLLPMAAIPAYLLTLALGITPHPGAATPGPVMPAQSMDDGETLFTWRDGAVLVIAFLVLVLLWRRLAGLLGRGDTELPPATADTVFGDGTALATRRIRRPRRGRYNADRQLLAAFLDFFRFLAMSGFSRPTGMPADRFLESLAVRLNGDPRLFQTAAETFNRVRYGRTPLAAEESREVRASLRRLRAFVVERMEKTTTGASRSE